MKTKILWDHSSIGSPVIFHPNLPNSLTVLLKEQTIGLGCRYLASTGCEHGTFVATLGVNKNGECLVASIDKFDERPNISSHNFLLPGDITVPCIFHQRTVCVEESPKNNYICILKSLHRNVSSSSEVSLGRSLALRLHIHLVGPNCKVELEGVIPTNSFRAVPVPPVPLLGTALSESLLRDPRCSPKTGFLTMDASQKLILLLENDPRMKTSPMIGIWVSGVCTVSQPFVWNSCLRFISCPDYSTRVVRPEEPFLLLVYSTLHLGPEFYDCLSNNSRTSYSLLEGHGQLTVTKVPSFTSRVCAVDLCPAENQKRLQLFHDAMILAQKDNVSLPYCDSAVLAFPSDCCEYPRSSPNPLKNNFVLKPSVPDLSLLSEVSRLSITKSIHTEQRPPLVPLSQLARGVERCSSTVGKKKTIMRTAVKENGGKVNPCVEPLPKQALEQHNKYCTIGDFRYEVEQILHSENTVATKDGADFPKSSSTEISAEIQRCNDKEISKSNRGETKANDVNLQNRVVSPVTVVRDITEGSATMRPAGVGQNSDTVPVSKPLETVRAEDSTSKSILFQNLHQLLKQKDTQMQELREQVKELLELQRHQISRSKLETDQPERSKDHHNLIHKIDKQNEQLNQLKDQISLLLENQVKNTSLSPKISLFTEMEKCSVGVMTSILSEPQIQNNVCTSDVRNQPEGQHYNRHVNDPTQAILPTSHRRNINDKLTGSSLFQKGGLVQPTKRHFGKHCGCQCTQTSKELTAENIRLGSVNNGTLSPERTMQLDLDSFQPLLGFSVDDSLPLGASVTLLEDRLQKQTFEHHCSSTGSTSSLCSERSTSMQLPLSYPDDRAWANDIKQQKQMPKRHPKSRLSLPAQKDVCIRRVPKTTEADDVLRSRHLSLDSDCDSFSRNDRWEGSMILPRLNYQTLCFSDDSDSESGDTTDKLSEKYLNICKNPDLTSKVSRTLKRPVAEGFAKNMSFATKEYLERYGLVS